MKAIDRLYQYFDYHKIKPTVFEKKIGLSNGYLGTQRRRNADLGSSIVENIINYCPDLDLNWLITGEGSMLKQDNTQPAAANSDLPPGPCRQCELRERLLAEKDERIAELREHLHDLRHQDQHKSKQRSA